MNEKKLEKRTHNHEAGAGQSAREGQPRAAIKHGCRGLLGNFILLALLNLAVVAMAAATLWFGWRGYTMTTTGEKTIAQVVRLAESTDSEGSCCVYSPVFEYTVAGRRHSFESMNASSPPSYRVGQQVEILYNPEDPDDAVVNSFGELWLVATLLCPATLVVALVVNLIGFTRIRSGQAILSEE